MELHRLYWACLAVITFAAMNVGGHGDSLTDMIIADLGPNQADDAGNLVAGDEFSFGRPPPSTGAGRNRIRRRL